MRESLRDPSRLVHHCKKLPCTNLDVWRFYNRLRMEHVFLEPSISGLCTNLQNIDKKDFISSRVGSIPTEDALAELRGAQSPAPIPDHEMEIEHLRFEEGHVGLSFIPELMPSSPGLMPSPSKRDGFTPIHASSLGPGPISEMSAGTEILPTPDLEGFTEPPSTEPGTPMTRFEVHFSLRDTGFSVIPELLNSAETDDLNFLEAYDTPASKLHECFVAFHALRFAPPIPDLGNKLADRMQSKGPYLALHLHMEKDVWVGTGCLPGLSHEYDEIIRNERKLRPELLTARSNMTYHDCKLAGLCPLNALEVTRLLKALEAPTNATIYWAGGLPLGGREALLPLIREFPHFYNKNDLALPGELEPFANRASLLAAIDYVVSENSDLFMPSHGGNMGHAIQLSKF
ncbi:O-fucosyltransferase 10-like [Telopea speciosissima]|uniref:O-fucosyltransferase 10-like n=1 Tax=Telopea speciosissima TaxID=54955 RepID=UPI001CC57616|nr:O-fucosyltransferase 10-like [Telopea speciosissima]